NIDNLSAGWLRLSALAVHAGPVLIQTLINIRVCARCCPGLCDGHNIKARHRLPMVAEGFSHQTLQPIALYCLCRHLARDSDTQTRVFKSVVPCVNGEQGVAAAAPLREHCTKCLRLQQPMLPTESIP
ncbi:MAG: hypothetical protein QGF79_08595, partial [Arenicellales bacterium]|nr:hypothetical protein [Arenicellales bacterium]